MSEPSDRRGGQARVVPHPQHLGRADFAHGRGAGDGGPGDRREPAAAHDGGHGDPPRQARQPDLGGVVDPGRDVRAVGDVAQCDEERDHRQIVGMDQVEEIGKHHRGGRAHRPFGHEGAGAKREDEEGGDGRDRREGKGDRHTQGEKDQDRGKGDHSDCGGVHQRASPSAIMSPACCCSSDTVPPRRIVPISRTTSSMSRARVARMPMTKISRPGHFGRLRSP